MSTRTIEYLRVTYKNKPKDCNAKCLECSYAEIGANQVIYCKLYKRFIKFKITKVKRKLRKRDKE